MQQLKVCVFPLLFFLPAPSLYACLSWFLIFDFFCRFVVLEDDDDDEENEHGSLLLSFFLFFFCIYHCVLMFCAFYLFVNRDTFVIPAPQAAEED